MPTIAEIMDEALTRTWDRFMIAEMKRWEAEFKAQAAAEEARRFALTPEGRAAEDKAKAEREAKFREQQAAWEAEHPPCPHCGRRMGIPLEGESDSDW